MDIGDIEVFIGIDVGKSEHWATALSQEGRKVLDRALPNDEDRLREVYQRLQAKGQVLVVVDLDCWVFFGQCLFSCFRLPSLSSGARVRPR